MGVNTVGAWAVVFAAFSIVTTVLLVVAAWRAMRAHERLAAAADDVAEAVHRISQRP